MVEYPEEGTPRVSPKGTPKKQPSEAKNYLILATLALAAILVIGMLISGWVIVEPGKRAFVITLGKASDRALSEGFHWKLPFITNVRKMSIRTRKYAPEETLSAATKDMQDLFVDVSINYRVDSDRITEVFRTIGTERTYVDTVVAPAIQQIVKETTVKFDAKDTLAQRDDLRLKVESGLRERFDTYGLIVEYVNIENLRFDEAFQAAIERKATALENQKAEERELEIIKIQALQRAAQAQGEADAILAKAKANAEAMKLQKEEITDLLNTYKSIEKWNGELPKNTCGFVPFIDIGE